MKKKPLLIQDTYNEENRKNKWKEIEKNETESENEIDNEQMQIYKHTNVS